MGFDRYTNKLKRKVRALQTKESELVATLEDLKVEVEILQMRNVVLKICLEGVEQQLVKHDELNEEMSREISQLKARIQQGWSQGSGQGRN